LDYTTLLLQLKNKLISLEKEGLSYLNIEKMPEAEQRQLYKGLEEIISIENSISSNKKNLPLKKNSKKTHLEIFQKEHNPPKKLSNKTDCEILNEKETTWGKQQTHAEEFKQEINKNVKKNNIDSINVLYKRFESCKRCELGEIRNNFVFGNGSTESEIMFIGEGPGADEDKLGEPFVGRAGKLLTKMINTIGIDRQDVYITNIVKCRPPQNRNPTIKEISCCLPILKKQIDIVNPKLIITLGNVPSKTLVPDLPGITKVHGQILQYENWKLLPTFHPSYLLRNRASMPLAWDDFKIISDVAFESLKF